MICRLPADYKESAHFKGHGHTPASGRSSWFVHDWLQIDVAAHPTNMFSHVLSVLPPRPIRSKVARLCMTILCFIFSANLPSNVRCYPWNRGDRTASFWWNVFIYRILNKRCNQVLTLGPKWLGPTWPTCPNFPYGVYEFSTRNSEHFNSKLEHFYLKLVNFNLKLEHFSSELEYFDSKLEFFNSKLEVLNSKLEFFNSKLKDFNSKLEIFNSKLEDFNSKLDKSNPRCYLAYVYVWFGFSKCVIKSIRKRNTNKKYLNLPMVDRSTSS